MKKKYPDCEFIVGDINKINKLFDKVFSIAVLHHIPSQFQKTFLNEVKKVLKDDGTLTLTVWNLKEKAKGKKEVYLPWYGTKGTYFYSFELEELIKLVNDTGLKVIESGEILVGEKPYSNFYIVAKN
jgi:cyclopropane fatty-acyl-phospholipid synthase-like methyltransferase